MNADRFWQLVESSRRGAEPERADGNMERQRSELRHLLSNLPSEEIIEFRNQFFERMNLAFSWELWGAAHLIAGGCSDDGFSDFRSWLISMGRRVFEGAISNVESLLDIADAPGIEDVFFEDFSGVPAQVYAERTGREIPAYQGHHPLIPAGEPWSEDGRELEQRLPKLWARYRGG